MKALEIALKHDMKALETALKHDMKEFETGLRSEVKQIDLKIEQVRADLARDLKDLEYRMTIKLGALMVVAVGGVAALVKLL